MRYRKLGLASWLFRSRREIAGDVDDEIVFHLALHALIALSERAMRYGAHVSAVTKQ